MMRIITKLLSFYTLFSITLYSCTKTSKEQKPIIPELLLNNENDQTISISDIGEVIDAIALECSPQCFLYEINKIIEFNEEYYIFDKRLKKIFVFDKTGIYLRQIGSLGIGPDQYQDISDFTIDKKNGNILILSTLSSSFIHEYNTNGEFIQKKELCNSLLWNITSTGNGIIGTTNHLTFTKGKDALLLYCFDNKYDLTTKQIQVLPKQLSTPILLSSPFQVFKDIVYYTDGVTNQIYCIHNNNIVETKYKIVLESPMPYDFFVDINQFIENQFEYDFIMDSFVSEDYVLITYIHNAQYRIKIIFKEHEQIICSGEFVGVFPKIFQGEDYSEILSPINPMDYLNYWKNPYDINISDNMEDNNFIIVKWKIRDLNKKGHEKNCNDL